MLLLTPSRDGASYQSLDDVLRRASIMVDEGATIIDIGGESTRPGADEVSLDEELSRVIPAVEKLSAELDVWISVDTYKSGVMREAIAGAHLINDIRALQEPGALEVVAESEVAICLMHMQGEPRTMQLSPHYDDLLTDISTFLSNDWMFCLMPGSRANVFYWILGLVWQDAGAKLRVAGKPGTFRML